MLEHIRSFYGGYFGTEPSKQNRKAKYKLIISAANRTSVLRQLQKFCIIKKPQIDAATEWADKEYENSDYYLKLVQGMKRKYSEITIDSERTTLPYLSGLFDAEVIIMLILITNVGLCRN